MPAPTRKPAPAAVIKEFSMCSVLLQTWAAHVAASVRPGSGLVDAKTKLLGSLALRPEHHPRSDQSGHVEQPSQHAGHAVRRSRTRSAAGTFSDHRPGAVGGSATRVWWPTLSDDERLVYATRVPPHTTGGVSEIDAVLKGTERGALWHKGQSRKVPLKP